MPSFAAQPGIVVTDIFIFGVQQIEEGCALIEFAAAQTAVEQGEATAISECKIDPAHGGNNALRPAMQAWIGFRPRPMSETIGDAAAHLNNVLRQRKFGHNNRVVGNVVQFGFKVNSRVVVVEADGAAERASPIESSGHLERRG